MVREPIWQYSLPQMLLAGSSGLGRGGSPGLLPAAPTSTGHGWTARSGRRPIKDDNMHRPLPRTPAEWLEDISQAIADAREAELFGALAGVQVTDANIFHLAPVVCLKFRGLDFRDEKLRKRVTEGALASYVANSDPEGIDHGLEGKPLLGFALCYIAAHHVLDLIDPQDADAVLNLCEEHLV